mmetsp:Transcript_7963/g.15188  ORF Transcript_7963/g.15188 Transcript_7963/m.15188 type:complete len:83 (+) Transcript_7963:51-299(+)
MPVWMAYKAMICHNSRGCGKRQRCIETVTDHHRHDNDGEKRATRSKQRDFPHYDFSLSVLVLRRKGLDKRVKAREEYQITTV